MSMSFAICPWCQHNDFKPVEGKKGITWECTNCGNSEVYHASQAEISEFHPLVPEGVVPDQPIDVVD